MDANLLALLQESIWKFITEYMSPMKARVQQVTVRLQLYTHVKVHVINERLATLKAYPKTTPITWY